MMDHKDGDCGCGGMCGKWKDVSKEDKIAHLEKKEEKLKMMLAHIQEVKESIKSGKDMGKDEK